MKRKRNKIPYKKPVEIYITDSEYTNIITGLNWDLCKERCDYIQLLLEKDGSIFQIKQDFFSKWGKTKETLALFKCCLDRWYDKTIESIDWEKVDPEKLTDISALQSRDIDPENEFLSRWGYSKENRAILESKTRAWNLSQELDTDYDYIDGDRGFDDVDIIRIIQNGNGDMYGY